MSDGAFQAYRELFTINSVENMAGINLNSEHSSENHYVKRTSAKSSYSKLQFHKNKKCAYKKMT